MSLITLIFFLLTSVIEGFEIINEQNNIIYIIKNNPIELKCQSSEKFYKCQWTRPKSSATCGLFNNNQKTDCPVTLKGKIHVLHILENFLEN